MINSFKSCTRKETKNSSSNSSFIHPLKKNFMLFSSSWISNMKIFLISPITYTLLLISKVHFYSPTFFTPKGSLMYGATFFFMERPARGMNICHNWSLFGKNNPSDFFFWAEIISYHSIITFAVWTESAIIRWKILTASLL